MPLREREEGKYGLFFYLPECRDVHFSLRIRELFITLQLFFEARVKELGSIQWFLMKDLSFRVSNLTSISSISFLFNVLSFSFLPSFSVPFFPSRISLAYCVTHDGDRIH